MVQCWETRVGQEMYKLTLFDLLINIAVLVLVEFPRRYISMFVCILLNLAKSVKCLAT